MVTVVGKAGHLLMMKSDVRKDEKNKNINLCGIDSIVFILDLDILD